MIVIRASVHKIEEVAITRPIEADLLAIVAPDIARLDRKLRRLGVAADRILADYEAEQRHGGGQRRQPHSNGISMR